MSTAIPSDRTERILRRILEKQGYRLSKTRKHGENGADIIVVLGDHQTQIEVIAYKRTGSARTKDFFEGIFRCLSRLDSGAYKCVLAMPVQFAPGMKQRAPIYHTAWKRLSLAFPEFSLWLVDCEAGSYRECKLTDWIT